MPEEEVLETPVEETEETPVEEEVNEVLPEVEITIYTTPDCTKCRFVKDYLTNKHITFTEKDAVDFAEEVADSWFQSAPIFKIVTNLTSQFMWDVEEFIHWIDDNGLGIQE